MKRYIAFLIVLVIICSLFSCNANNENNDSSSSDTADTTNTNIPSDSNTDVSSDSATDGNTDKSTSSTEDPSNKLVIQAYGAALRSERKIYLSQPSPSIAGEIYFKELFGLSESIPTHQLLIDMDKDGIEELILYYNDEIVLLHFENDTVYITGFDLNAMETIYEDGSFSWSNTDDIFGYECGISRLSFSNGVKKIEELCRIEGNSKFFINGERVAKEQYYEYVDNANKTPAKFMPFDTSLIDSDEVKAIELASAHWGIKDGDFDPETGARYRIISNGKSGGGYRYSVSLYRFAYNSYYEHLEVAMVDVDTGEIGITKYPDGKG